MDHTEAVRLQAAAKYALGELTPAQMEEYEEHYFDCAECALDVKAVMAFVDTSCKVFPELDSEKELVPQAASAGWFHWLKLKPIWAVPAFAALLLAAVGGYRMLGPVPGSNNDVPVAAALHVQPSVGLEHVVSTFFRIHDSRGVRGEVTEAAKAEDRVAVHAGQTFELVFDFSPKPQFSHYVGQLQDEKGKPVLEFSLGDINQREIHLPVPAGQVQTGNYQLMISGDPGNTGHYTSVKDKQVAYFSFPVEILP